MSRILALLILLGLVPAARADATVVTRAMTASTIAEVFVEDEQVRVVVEIGIADLLAFHNLLPDEIREHLGLAPEPLEERLPRFFAEDWTVRADGGPPLPGFLQAIEGRRRLVRDEISGDPIANQPADAETVVCAEFVYLLDGQPAELTLKPPHGTQTRDTANIGFVLYHSSLPVNDFRYLSRAETVDLDWEDPWYSKFRNKNLWRLFEAPLSAYLYVEPFEVRKEVVIRPRDLQRWVDLGLEGSAVIRAEDWGTLKQQAVEFLIARCPVLIDGREVEPVLDRVHFIERTLRTSRVLEEPRDLDVVSATLGVIISYPTRGLPQEATMEWDLFPDEAPRVPTSAVDEAGGLPSFLTREDNTLRWQNFLLQPRRGKLVELDPPPAPANLFVPLVSLLCFAGALGSAALLRRKRVGRSVGAVLVVAAVLAWPFARVEAKHPFTRSATLNEEQAAQVCGDLLRNVYRAFDFRAESDIYDMLAQSTEGELLTSVYLETRQSLELENQGGARVRIQAVDMIGSDTVTLGRGPGFKSHCTWNVTGSVGHWGHLHQRRNQYEAQLTVEPVQGQWKITGLELLNEARL